MMLLLMNQSCLWMTKKIKVECKIPPLPVPKCDTPAKFYNEFKKLPNGDFQISYDTYFKLGKNKKIAKECIKKYHGVVKSTHKNNLKDDK